MFAPTPLRRVALLMVLAAVGACDRAPSEPPSARPPSPPARPAEPSMEAAALRVAAAVDGGIGPVHPLGVPTPARASAVGFTLGGMDSAALVDGERAWVGRDGAERALALWVAQGGLPDATQLARTVGAMVYPGCPVWLGGGRPAAGEGEAPVRGPAPSLVAHPGGGRVLSFSFVIPEGRPGAGLHVARWRWTDSGLLIEASPHPERR